MTPLTAVHTNRNGDVFVGEEYSAAAFDGRQERPLRAEDTIPLPAGATLMALDSRRAQAFDGRGGLRTLGRERWSLSALLPTGYTRTLYPAYADEPGQPDLPLFGYAAIGMLDGDLRVAAIATDPAPEWDPKRFNTPDLRSRVNEALGDRPSNKMLRQLARCARDYGCYTAQNVFYGRWEAALPVSPACNARCVGCISLQEGETAAPQERFKMTPTADEIAEIAVAHLERPDSYMVSFGQGCEGEPLLAARTIAEAIAKIRTRTARGIVHLNTNASLPTQLRRLIDAGLQSIRVSTISALPATYAAYYRPSGYGWSDVRASLHLAAERGLLINFNLLVLPGLTDRPEEVEAFVGLLRDLPSGVVQLRNLNADPKRALSVFEPPAALVGIPAMLERYHAEAPHFALRSFTRPLAVEA
ncbi:MAG: radical SAM protein [Chloroflexi bacterium]|nr:MAG: radical SAM protein [Chloroflexota bacterium]